MKPKLATPMVGDPPEAKRTHDADLRKLIIYRCLMAEKQAVKTGVVPERLRVGLWYHW